jgi:hypothetical protein
LHPHKKIMNIVPDIYTAAREQGWARYSQPAGRGFGIFDDIEFETIDTVSPPPTPRKKETLSPLDKLKATQIYKDNKLAIEADSIGTANLAAERYIGKLLRTATDALSRRTRNDGARYGIVCFTLSSRNTVLDVYWPDTEPRAVIITSKASSKNINNTNSIYGTLSRELSQKKNERDVILTTLLQNRINNNKNTVSYHVATIPSLLMKLVYMVYRRD